MNVFSPLVSSELRLKRQTCTQHWLQYFSLIYTVDYKDFAYYKRKKIRKHYVCLLIPDFVSRFHKYNFRQKAK